MEFSFTSMLLYRVIICFSYPVMCVIKSALGRVCDTRSNQLQEGALGRVQNIRTPTLCHQKCIRKSAQHTHTKLIMKRIINDNIHDTFIIISPSRPACTCTCANYDISSQRSCTHGQLLVVVSQESSG